MIKELAKRKFTIFVSDWDSENCAVYRFKAVDADEAADMAEDRFHKVVNADREGDPIEVGARVVFEGYHVNCLSVGGNDND